MPFTGGSGRVSLAHPEAPGPQTRWEGRKGPHGTQNAATASFKSLPFQETARSGAPTGIGREGLRNQAWAASLPQLQVPSPRLAGGLAGTGVFLRPAPRTPRQKGENPLSAINAVWKCTSFKVQVLRG